MMTIFGIYFPASAVLKAVRTISGRLYQSFLEWTYTTTVRRRKFFNRLQADLVSDRTSSTLVTEKKRDRFLQPLRPVPGILEVLYPVYPRWEPEFGYGSGSNYQQERNHWRYSFHRLTSISW
jgi:hypothetical protein